MIRFLLIVLALLIVSAGAPGRAAACSSDHTSRVAAGTECLAIKAFGKPAAETALIVMIHGDGSRGGASDYLYPMAEKFGAAGVVAVGLIRPGYFDSGGNTSSGQSYRDEGDGYRPAVVDAIAQAVRNLKTHYNAKKTILAGHSGGAAIAGVILGRHPDVADGAVLAACPCNVPDWRIERRGENTWYDSLSPHAFVETVRKDIQVIALTGDADTNTSAGIAKDYINQLSERGVAAAFESVPDAGHNRVVRTGQFLDAINRLALAP